MTTASRLKEIFDDVLQPGDSFDPAKEREDYENWDSLATVSIMLAITEEFGDVVTLEEMETLNSFGKLLELIDRRIA